MSRIKVALSPFYGRDSWTDELTGITFEKGERGLNTYSIPTTANLKNIDRAIRLNSLLLIDGAIEEFNDVKHVFIKEEELVSKEVVVEEKVEKKEVTKKATAKKNTDKGTKK